MIGRIAVSVALATVAGGSLLGRPVRLRDGSLLSWLSATFTVGWVVAVPLVLLIGVLGLPVTGPWIAGLLLAISAVGWRFGSSGRSGLAALGRDESLRVWKWLSAALVLVALAAFVWKVASVPIWVWDHYIVWGVKSRRMVTDGSLDLQFLSASPFQNANADYPLGLPLGWRVMTLGREPSLAEFKVCHILFGLAVVGLVLRTLAEAGLDIRRANGAAAFVAISPLFWNSETVGIAECRSA